MRIIVKYDLIHYDKLIVDIYDVNYIFFIKINII